uniref:Uncharacterized protein n=1 Tax=Cucumis sativus TaxID=3659 RepID=A0A0A0K8A9_CUCSA
MTQRLLHAIFTVDPTPDEFHQILLLVKDLYRPWRLGEVANNFSQGCIPPITTTVTVLCFEFVDL